MTRCLHDLGYGVDVKRVRRLPRLMGLEAIYPKPRLSVGAPEHRKFPYLLRGLDIGRPNQVWCADITYLRLRHGFAYLVAIMDWFSRYVLAWEVSNTDQGSQFTSEDYLGRLEGAGVQISMDGRGRFLDNIFVERLWRTVKYEDIFIHDYETVAEARGGSTEILPVL